jgi:hypothetical protein
MGVMRDPMLRGSITSPTTLKTKLSSASFKSFLPASTASRRVRGMSDVVLRDTLRHVGEGVVVRPFDCEYGDRTFVNVDAVVVDGAPVTIGAAGPRARRTDCCFLFLSYRPSSARSRR